MDTFTKCIIIFIIILVVYSHLTYKVPLVRFTLQKENIRPGTIILPSFSSQRELFLEIQPTAKYGDNYTQSTTRSSQRELFLEIQPTAKYGDNYIHIKMTP